MNSMEEKLWNYIDGTCAADEHKAISTLIEQDETYRLKYYELIKLNKEISGMELDEPGMAFTYNVMETIRAEHAQTPLKASVNKWIINGIAAFFIITIAALLIFTLSGIQWSSQISGPAFQAPQVPFHLTAFLKGPAMQGFLFFDVILMLFLLDTFLRKKTATGVYKNM